MLKIVPVFPYYSASHCKTHLHLAQPQGYSLHAGREPARVPQLPDAGGVKYVWLVIRF